MAISSPTKASQKVENLEFANNLRQEENVEAVNHKSVNVELKHPEKVATNHEHKKMDTHSHNRHDPYHGKGIMMGAAMHHDGKTSFLSENGFALFSVILYIVVGIAFYTQAEGWSVIDCIYYCMVIITTVGYGDLYPTNDGTKVFTIFFALLGIGTIGMALGKIAEWFLSRQKAMADEASKKILQNAGNAASKAAQEKDGSDRRVSTKTEKEATRKPLLSDDAKSLVMAIAPMFGSVGVGMLYGVFEGWTFVDSLYTTIITVTTIGFGDFSPKSQSGRLFAIFYLPFAVIAVANAIGSIAELIAKRGVVKTEISMKELIEMDQDGDGAVSQVEYLSYMLIKLGKADQDDIDEIINQFNKLDVDGSGSLDKEDLERLDKQLAASKSL